MKGKIRFKIALWLSLMMFFVPVMALAQVTVTGNVSDDMGPIIGANVIVKGGTTGVISDIDGNFKNTSAGFEEDSPENKLYRLSRGRSTLKW